LILPIDRGNVPAHYAWPIVLLGGSRVRFAPHPDPTGDSVIRHGKEIIIPREDPVLFDLVGLVAVVERDVVEASRPVRTVGIDLPVR